MAEKLDAGSTFPEIHLQHLDGRPASLPGDFETDYAVVLFFRGHW